MFWKTDDQPDHIPKWEDPGIQAEVLRVWKLNEARKLALKRADELKAEAAANSGKSLKELASGQEEGFHGSEPAGVQFSDSNVWTDNSSGRSFWPGEDRRPYEDSLSCRRCSAWPRTRWTLPRICPRPRSTWSAPSSSRRSRSSGRTSSPMRTTGRCTRSSRPTA